MKAESITTKDELASASSSTCSSPKTNSSFPELKTTNAPGTCTKQEQTEVDPTKLLSKKITNTAIAVVNPKLTELPLRPAFLIVAVVVLINVAFVAWLTRYNLNQSNVGFGIVDTHWTYDFEQDEVNPYRRVYASPTHICSSWAPTRICGDGDDDGCYTSYEVPCLLDGLTCEEDYSDPKCKDEEKKYPFRCSNDYPLCGDENELASVEYVEGQTFTVAFGAAQGYLMWVQLFTLLFCLGVYFVCFAQAGIKDTVGHVTESLGQELGNANPSNTGTHSGIVGASSPASIGVLTASSSGANVVDGV